MTIQFLAPGVTDQDGGVAVPATVDGETVICRFTVEVLREVNQRTRLSAAINQYMANAAKLRAAAERVIRAGRIENGGVVVVPSDLHA